MLKLAISGSKNSPFYFSQTTIWGFEELDLDLCLKSNAEQQC